MGKEVNQVNDVDNLSAIEMLSFSEVEELESANREAGWDLEYWQLLAGDFSARFTVQESATTLLMRERYSCSLEVHGQSPEGSVIVIMPRKSVKLATLNGAETTNDRVFMVSSGTELDSVVQGSLDLDSFHMPEHVLHQAAAVFDSSFPDGVLRVDVDAQRLQHLRRIFTDLYSATPGSIGSQELEANLALYTAELTTNWQEGHHDASLLINPDGAFDRAREYIEANLQGVLLMADICAYAKIKIRSLQRLFLVKLDLTPTQYILARRMNSVRRRLLVGELGVDRVTDIAIRHGVNHLGRFSVRYRAFFGETPRQTLQGRFRL